MTIPTAAFSSPLVNRAFSGPFRKGGVVDPLSLQIVNIHMIVIPINTPVKTPIRNVSMGLLNSNNHLQIIFLAYCNNKRKIFIRAFHGKAASFCLCRLLFLFLGRDQAMGEIGHIE
jgi:hypothetical protein